MKTKIFKKTEEAGLYYWGNIQKNYGMIEIGNKSMVYTRLAGCDIAGGRKPPA